MRFRFVRAVGAFVVASLVAVAASAQTVGAGSILGKITDETGAVLPGATVTIKSPSLQLPQLDTLTAVDGSYRFLDVPIGTYRVQYKLSGFQTIVREDIKVSAGFVARLDIIMKVGALAETVTVSGISPIIDTTTTAGITSFSKETLETAPTTRAWAEVLAMAPGFRPASLDIGGDQLANQRVGIKNYGTSDQITPQIEGINTRQASGSAGFFYDYSSLEEAQIKAVGNDAEVALPGGAWNALVKSGGNDFHGRYFGAFENQSLQSDNLTDKLRAAGVSNNTGMRTFRDFSGDLGGRLVRDQLWFYGAAHDQRNDKNLIGFSLDPGPDGIYHTPDDTPAYDRTIVKNATGKAPIRRAGRCGWSASTPTTRKCRRTARKRAGSLHSSPTYNYLFPTRATKAELNATPNNRLLYTVMFGRQWYDANRYPQDGQNVKGNPQWTDRETGYNFGPQPTQLRPRSRWQIYGRPELSAEFISGRQSQPEGGLSVLLGKRRHGLAEYGQRKLSADLRSRERPAASAGRDHDLQRSDHLAGEQGSAVRGLCAGPLDGRPRDDQSRTAAGSLSHLCGRADQGTGRVRQQRHVPEDRRAHVDGAGAAGGNRLRRRRQGQDRRQGHLRHLQSRDDRRLCAELQQERAHQHALSLARSEQQQRLRSGRGRSQSERSGLHQRDRGAATTSSTPISSSRKPTKCRSGLEREVMNNFGAKVLYVYKRQIGALQSPPASTCCGRTALTPCRLRVAIRVRTATWAPPTMAAM